MSSCKASWGFWPLSQGQVRAIKGFYTPEKSDPLLFLREPLDASHNCDSHALII